MDQLTHKKIVTTILQALEKEENVSNEFLYSLVGIIKEEENLQDYIANIDIRDIPCGAWYDYNTKTFTFSEESLKNRNPKLANAFLDRYDRELYQYLKFTRLILKEIEYANEIKLGQDKNNADLKAKILRESYYCHVIYNQFLLDTEVNETRKKTIIHPKKPKNFIKKHKFDRDNKQLSPEEYYAQVASYENILEIVELVENERIKYMFYDELCAFFLETYYLAYSVSKIDVKNKGKCSPVLYYLEQIGINKRTRNYFYTQSQELDPATKLKLGLEMSKKELIKIQTTQYEVKKAIKLQKNLTI